MANSSTSQNSSGLLSLIFAGQAKSSWVLLNGSIAKASWQPLLEGCQERRLLRFAPGLGRFFPSLLRGPCWAPAYWAGFWLQTMCPGSEMEWTTESVVWVFFCWRWGFRPVWFLGNTVAVHLLCHWFGLHIKWPHKGFWVYLLRSFTAFIFFFSFLYIGAVCLTSSLPVSPVVTVLGKARQ